jgi:MFS family permease
MLLNWGVESFKWRLLVSGLEKISYPRAVRAVFTGQALAFSTINRLGESVGRALFLSAGNRIRGAVLSVAGSMSQLLVTIIAGWLALLFIIVLHPEISLFSGEHAATFERGCLLLFAGLAILLWLIYFHPAAMVAALEKIPWVKQFDFFLERLAALPSAGLTRILLLSALRFVIYTAQYLLLFQLFGVTLTWLTGAALVSMMMLLLALVPTIALAELGFRGQISLRLFSLVSANYAGIMATAAGIWVINLIIPALAGSLLVLGIRIFTKKKR